MHVIAPRSFDAAVISLLKRNWPGADAELAYLEPIPMTLVLNERHACIFFKGLDGRVDFNQGIYGESEAFRGWCRDLFDYLSERARKALL